MWDKSFWSNSASAHAGPLAWTPSLCFFTRWLACLIHRGLFSPISLTMPCLIATWNWLEQAKLVIVPPLFFNFCWSHPLHILWNPLPAQSTHTSAGCIYATLHPFKILSTSHALHRSHSTSCTCSMLFVFLFHAAPISLTSSTFCLPLVPWLA